MSLTKIPFILLVTWGFNASLTPPNPPPPKHERIASQVPMDNHKFIYWGTLFCRVLQLFFATVEIVTILVYATPSSPLSKPILSLLVWSDSKPDNLRISTAGALGVILMTLGAGIRLMTYRFLGRFFQSEVSIQKDHELVVSGPYAVVRHPSYTGLILVVIGWFPWQLGKGSWVMVSGFWNMTLGRTLVMLVIGIILTFSYLALKRTPREDVALRKQFGTKWDDWARRVPYSIFPGIF